jgi:D-lyxose ketol-isomerase
MEDLHDELLYKHLYVAISRARRSDQIIFKTSQVADILPTDYKNKKWYKSGLDISTLENTSSDILSKMSAETIINTFIEKVSKKFPVFALYKDEKQKENNNHTDLEKNEYILKCKQYEESTKYGNIEIKRKKAIQKYLREHNGIGFSKKWSDLEKDYAESIREKYWK